MQHPYRFVFLDACTTGLTRDWQHAFGIVDGPPGPGPYTDPDPPRAFLGWEGLKDGPYGPPEEDPANMETVINDYGTTINIFYDMWMSGATLDQCIKACSVNYLNNDNSVNSLGQHFPLPVPANKRIKLSDGSLFILRHNPHLKLVGYQGLTRKGYDPSYPTGVKEY
jgi:hypothetical protein